VARCIRAEVPAEKDLQVPEEESGGHGKANTDESIVERCDFEISRDLSPIDSFQVSRTKLTSQRRPRHQRHRNPNQIGIPIKCPALHQIRALAPKPLQHSPQAQRNEKRIPINQPRRSAQQLEIICEMLFPRARQVLADSARQEQDHNYGRCYPEGPVEVWVAFEDVEEVLARVEGGAAAGEDLVRVDVEELLVEADAPEETLGGGGLAGAWCAEEVGVGLDFGGAGGVVVECWWEVLVGWSSVLVIRVIFAYCCCGIPDCLLGRMLVGGVSWGIVYLGHMSGAVYQCVQDLPRHPRRLRHRNLVCLPWLSMVSCVIEQAPVPVGAQVDLDNARNSGDVEAWARPCCFTSKLPTSPYFTAWYENIYEARTKLFSCALRATLIIALN
jgi:hypothetical protein